MKNLPKILVNSLHLHFAQNRILTEQLRLIYASMPVTILPMFPAVVLLVWALIHSANRTGLLLWAVAVSLPNLYLIFEARRCLARGLAASDAVLLAKRLIFTIAIGGASWGGLAFATLGHTSEAANMMVIFVLSGILGGSVSLLSPVLLVFVAFSTPLVGLTVVKLWQLGDPTYNTFGIIALMYLGVLIAQARNSSVATCAAIEMRFENLELMRKAELAQASAEHANAAKSKFLAAASHDLRQPIHAQGLFLDILMHSPLTPHQRGLVGNISAASTASADMLNNLLDYSRIEAGVVTPHIQPFEVQHLLNKIECEFAPQADAKGLGYRSRETRLQVQSDAALVELILRNLVSNAIRYSNSGGVLVACRPRGPSAVLEVWDTGIGIAQEQQARVFEEFAQLGNPERDRRNGLGLGLAIAQGLATTLGHALSLQSVPQRGSIFRLSLPMAEKILSPEQASAANNKALLPRIVTRKLLGVRVLIIDDDEAVQTAMAQVLRHWGCDVDAASTEDEACTLVQRHNPALVISDYRLRSHRTGAQAIAQVRSLLGVQVPALLITGDTAPERLREAMSSGVPLLHKPLAPDALYKAITDLLDDTKQSPPAQSSTPDKR